MTSLLWINWSWMAGCLESRQDDLRSQSQDNTKKMKTLAAQADNLRGRMAAAMQSKYGFTSQTLLKFGVKIRKVPRRQAAAKKEPPVTVARSSRFRHPLRNRSRVEGLPRRGRRGPSVFVPLHEQILFLPRVPEVARYL